jgi:4-amino-4-deoxy-L-arabinose transferase-like glycosyltransferase
LTFSSLDNDFTIDSRPPAYKLVLTPIFKSFGVGVPQARSVSQCAGLLLIVVVFFAVRALAGPIAGVASAMWCAVDTFVWISARTVRPEIPIALLGTMALLLFLESRDHNSWLISFSAGSAPKSLSAFTTME